MRVTWAFFLGCLGVRQDRSEVLMEGHVAMDHSWPWASWARAGLYTSVWVVMVSGVSGWRNSDVPSGTCQFPQAVQPSTPNYMATQDVTMETEVHLRCQCWLT